MKDQILTTTFVVGATGKTGKALVAQLLAKDHTVRVVVRSPQKFSTEILENPNLTIVTADLLDLDDEALAGEVRGCDTVVSCLGHTVDVKGMFGQPRKLCTEAVSRLCAAIEQNGHATPVKFILMNTVGVKNPDLDEKRSLFDRGVLEILHHALPPHRDNETAAEQLQDNVGKNNVHIVWCVVRPDSLIDDQVSAYDLKESPTTGIFTGRPTTRENVAHFMTELISNDQVWQEWKYRMPVIMNAL